MILRRAQAAHLVRAMRRSSGPRTAISQSNSPRLLWAFRAGSVTPPNLYRAEGLSLPMPRHIRTKLYPPFPNRQHLNAVSWHRHQPKAEIEPSISHIRRKNPQTRWIIALLGSMNIKMSRVTRPDVRHIARGIDSRILYKMKSFLLFSLQQDNSHLFLPTHNSSLLSLNYSL